MVPSPENAAERIDRSLTRAILRGAYPPGTRLPTVRELAVEHDVNPSTVQRALARLERRGLVTARQGSGVVVNDPEASGDLSLIPDWLEATADEPERAAAILADLLEARRVLAVRLIVRHRAEVLAAFERLEAEALHLLEVAPDDRWEADLAFARTITDATGNVVAGAVLRSLSRALAEVPMLATAMFEEPSRNAATMLEVVDAVRTGGEHLAERIDVAVARIDDHTVAAFRRRLTEALEEG